MRQTQFQMALSINLWISIVKFSIRKSWASESCNERLYAHIELKSQMNPIAWHTQALEPLNSSPYNIWPCVCRSLSSNGFFTSLLTTWSWPKAGSVQGSCKESSCWTHLEALPIPCVRFTRPSLAEPKHSETFWCKPITSLKDCCYF